MWFVLGLLTLAGAATLMAWWRWDVHWSGERHDRCRFKLSTNKGRVQALRVGIRTTTALDFELKPEGWFDRAAKAIGVSVEAQANRRSFDELVYVLADDERLERALRLDADLLAQLEAISRARVGGFRFHRLVCRRGQLWIDFKPEGKENVPPEATQWAQQALLALAQALPALSPGTERRLDRGFLRAAILLGLSSGLAISGLGQLLRAALSYFPYTVDTTQLWWLGAGAGAILLLLLAVSVLVLLGRSSRAHLVLLEVLLIGGVGAFATCFVEMRDFNMEADNAPVQEYDTVVLAKHVSSHRQRSGGTSHSYYLELSDWNGGERVDVQVSSSDYSLHTLGQHLRVRQHPGFFGVRWVESID